MKTRLIALLVCGAALAFVTGCKETVDIVDGQVPDQYLAHAKKAEGTYYGQFNNTSGELKIQFVGNRPVVTFKSRAGRDLLGANCGSKIGNLTAVVVKGDANNPRITAAEFAFDPGQCRLLVQGRTLYVDFKSKDSLLRLDLTMIQRVDQTEVCGWWDGYYGWGGWGYGYGSLYYPPYYDCRTHTTYQNLYGQFTRK